MGNAFKEQGHYDDAIEAYKKATSIRPDVAEVHNNMGIILRDQGHLEEAIEAYIRAISLKGDYAHAWNNLFYPLQTIKAHKGDIEI